MGLRLGLLAADLAKFPADLSGGMRQRVSFSRALLTRPDLLFLDEPFSALDIGLKRELQQVLLDDAGERGMAVFFITHDLMEAVRLADRILVLAGSPGQIAGRYEFDLPPTARSDQYVSHHSAALLSDPVIIENFSLRVGLG
jgi:NitT/TauT family transport system ATP-binding protein